MNRAIGLTPASLTLSLLFRIAKKYLSRFVADIGSQPFSDLETLNIRKKNCRTLLLLETFEEDPKKSFILQIATKISLHFPKSIVEVMTKKLWWYT